MAEQIDQSTAQGEPMSDFQAFPTPAPVPAPAKPEPPKPSPAPVAKKKEMIPDLPLPRGATVRS